jgi:TonB family protein
MSRHRLSQPARWVWLSLIFACICLPAGRLCAQEEPVSADVGPPILRDWVRPDYPKAAVAAKREGKVQVQFVVEVDGRTTREKIHQSTDAIFNEAALAAVRQWTFKPGIDQGEPAPYAMGVTIEFQLSQLHQPAPMQPTQALQPFPLAETPAKAKGSIEPPYPDELEARKIPGEVNVEFTVNPDGLVEQPKVLWASHPAFVETALRTIERASFAPAQQGFLPRKSVVKYPVGFESMGAKPAEILAANHLTLESAEAPTILPRLLMLVQPVYPYELLIEGKTGQAEVEFTLGEAGRPTEISVLSADAPEFGAALRAAVESWVFRPAQDENGPCLIKMKAMHNFAPGELPVESRLASLLQTDGAGIPEARGLDRKLKPLWRGFPVYPQSLLEERLNGEVQIQFVIDRDGRARLPKILSATHEAFGWAAATAISQWVFERPTKGGEPVDITVRIPVGFAPPSQ